MHYFHTHFNVYPNPQGKVHTSNYKAAANFANSELRVSHNAHNKLGGREDVQHQIDANEPGAGPNVWQTEQHPQGDHKVQAILEVGPFVAPIQGFTVAHPKHAVVGQVCDVPEQEQGPIVVVDQDVLVSFEEDSHCSTVTQP